MIKRTSHVEKPLSPVLLWTGGSVLILLLLVAALSNNANKQSVTTADNPPIHFAPETDPDAPVSTGDIAKDAKAWDEYYATPKGRKQLEKDKKELERQMADPETRRRVQDILK